MFIAIYNIYMALHINMLLYIHENNWACVLQFLSLLKREKHEIEHYVYRHDVTKVGDIYNGVYGGNFSFFVGSSWNFVPGYIKKVDTHHESFS